MLTPVGSTFAETSCTALGLPIEEEREELWREPCEKQAVRDWVVLNRYN